MFQKVEKKELFFLLQCLNNIFDIIVNYRKNISIQFPMLDIFYIIINYFNMQI